MAYEMVNAVAASNLVASAVQAALMASLVRKGVLTTSEVTEVYEQALLLLEAQQGAAPTSQDVFDAARELIEQHLRPKRP